MVRGDIYYADLNPVIGSEQGGNRPVLIIQNNIGNKYSPTVICAAITSEYHKKKPFPTHVHIEGASKQLHNSVVLLEQLRTIDKSRLKEWIGRLSGDTMKQVNQALRKSIEV